MYLCLSIINCLPVFPSAPMADSWVCLSQVRYQHELELSRELQSKCRSSDETRKCKVSPNPPDRVTVIVSKGKVHFKVLPNQSEYYFGRKNTLTQHWAHRGQFTNTYWLSQCICRLNKILWKCCFFFFFFVSCIFNPRELSASQHQFAGAGIWTGDLTTGGKVQ